MTIELIDGTQLPCYLSAKPEKKHSTELLLDASGEYLSINPMSEPQKRQSPMEMAQPFLSHISLILEHQEAILSDSRLFLSKVPIQNALAFIGTSGFQNPTLGVYIEWWRHFYQESHDQEGNPVWFISGSPLSGNHACSSVSSDGMTTHCCKLQMCFGSTWRSFMEVNNRYADAKALCEAYTVEQAINHLNML